MEKKINFWKAPWVSELPLAAITNLDVEDFPDLTVKDVINQDTKEWNLEAVDSLINEELTNLIKAIPIPSYGDDADYLIWKCGKDGKVTVKEAYKSLFHPRLIVLLILTGDFCRIRNAFKK